MLSAHQPFETYPAILRKAVSEAGGFAQVAGGVPAMCDGITQGRAGMELSLFSRDVIAMGTAVALSHDMFDGALMLGVCDKIVPGLLTGALTFWSPPHGFCARWPAVRHLECHKSAGPSGVRRRHRRPRSAYGRRNGRLPCPGEHARFTAPQIQTRC